MNKNYKRATYTMFLFGFLFFYLVIHFAIVGPADFQLDRINKLISAAVILVVMVLFAVMLIATNKKTHISDERDILFQKQASTIGLTVTGIFVFVLAITIFIINEDKRFVDVSWLWFIAYATFAFSYFSTSLILFILYKRDE